MARPISDFAQVLRRIFRIARYAGIVLAAVTVVMLGRELHSLYRLAGGVHPVLGWAFLALVGAAAVLLVGVPVYRFLRVPVALRAPRMPEHEEEWTAAHLRARADYLGRYLSALGRNPALRDRAERISAAGRKLAEVRRGLSGSKDAAAARRSLAEFERGVLDPLLDPLDREVDRLIRAEALSVGVATALSPNGTLDAFIVLWRNANLVSRIANIYYGRPGIRGSLKILRDVSAAMFLAGFLEGLSEMAGSFFRGVFGSLAGIVAGPLLDGGVNALATLRIGYLAKARCRSFKAWTDATRRQALAEALGAARKRSKEVFAEIAKAAGGTLSDLTGRVGRGVKDGLASLFRKMKGEDVEPAGEGA